MKHEQRVRHSVDLRLCPVNLMKFRLINHRSPWRRWIFEAVEAEGCKDPPEQIHAGSSHGKIQISSTWFLPSFMFFLKSGVSLNWDRNSLAPPPSPSTRFYTDEWKRGAFVLITIIIVMAIRGRLKGRKQRGAFIPSCCARCFLLSLFLLLRRKRCFICINQRRTHARLTRSHQWAQSGAGHWNGLKIPRAIKQTGNLALAAKSEQNTFSDQICKQPHVPASAAFIMFIMHYKNVYKFLSALSLLCSTLKMCTFTGTVYLKASNNFYLLTQIFYPFILNKRSHL